MYRIALLLGAAALLTAGAATAQSGDRSYRFPMPSNPRGSPFDSASAAFMPPAPPAATSRQVRPNKWQLQQLIRWGDVGKCVTAKDREASLSYIAAPHGSAVAAAAAERLDPVFATCLQGAGIAQKGNKAYRRAAIADALGIRPAAAS